MNRTILNSIIYIVNFTVSGILAWISWASYAIWVQPPIGNTREESIRLLNFGILKTAGILLIISLLIMSVVTFLTWFACGKIDLHNRKRNLMIILAINFSIIVVGLIFGITNAKNGLTIEIDRYFF